MHPIILKIRKKEIPALEQTNYIRLRSRKLKNNREKIVILFNKMRKFFAKYFLLYT
jgi:hypothetical protein